MKHDIKCYFCKKLVPLAFHARFTLNNETELRYAHWMCLHRADTTHVLNLVHSKSFARDGTCG